MGLREQIGPYGAWVSSRSITPELSAALEESGYGALWLGGAAADLSGARRRWPRPGPWWSAPGS